MTKTFILLIVAALLVLGCTSANVGGSSNNSTVKGEGQIVDVGGSIPIQGEPSGNSGSAPTSGQSSGHDGITTSESGNEMTLNSTVDKDGPIEGGGSIGMKK